MTIAKKQMGPLMEALDWSYIDPGSGYLKRANLPSTLAHMRELWPLVELFISNENFVLAYYDESKPDTNQYRARVWTKDDASPAEHKANRKPLGGQTLHVSGVVVVVVVAAVVAVVAVVVVVVVVVFAVAVLLLALLLLLSTCFCVCVHSPFSVLCRLYFSVGFVFCGLNLDLFGYAIAPAGALCLTPRWNWTSCFQPLTCGLRSGSPLSLSAGLPTPLPCPLSPRPHVMIVALFFFSAPLCFHAL